MEVGAGPGQVIEPPPQQQQQQAASQVAGPSSTRDGEDEPRRPRRSRPIPKPLHQPTFDIPPTSMEEMLSVWDKIGLTRVDNFIHSSMVMKVFASGQAPGSNAEAALYEPEIPVAEGENPFISQGEPGDTEEVASSLEQGKPSAPPLDFEGQPFAYAGSENIDPFHTAAVENPFSTVKPTLLQKKPAEQKPAAPPAESAQAPVTPFGQLPAFGTSSGQSPSPFAAASPFAASSPFAATATGAASPFAASPFAASPFAASPFASATGSPFGASHFPSADAATFPPEAEDSRSTSTSTEIEKKHTCSTCGKAFTSEQGLSMHAKEKHGITIPVVLKANKKGKLPDLPAYVPCPVDIGSTQPFGVQASQISWGEVELIPHAQSISNIMLIGEVLEIESVGADTTQLSVLVPGQAPGEEETFVVKCVGAEHKQLVQDVRRHSMVHITGTLRLLPLYEQSCNKYYQQPIVRVSPPLGSIFVLE